MENSIENLEFLLFFPFLLKERISFNAITSIWIVTSIWIDEVGYIYKIKTI